MTVTVTFQSTPSGGKATVACRSMLALKRRFNPRLPGGRRPFYYPVRPQGSSFNPRLPGGRRLISRPYSSRSQLRFQSTPSGGKATRLTKSIIAVCAFQSTPSGGKATHRRYCRNDRSAVSIHAFRGEGDYNTRRLRMVIIIVSIHAFRGEGDSSHRS